MFVDPLGNHLILSIKRSENSKEEQKISTRKYGICIGKRNRSKKTAMIKLKINMKNYLNHHIYVKKILMLKLKIYIEN